MPATTWNEVADILECYNNPAPNEREVNLQSAVIVKLGDTFYTVKDFMIVDRVNDAKSFENNPLSDWQMYFELNVKPIHNG
jgi:hypothetical protein